MSNRTRLSVSTWSLHRVLGPVFWDSPAKPRRTPEEPYGPGTMTLIEIPAKIAKLGIRTLEICHFHLPSRDIAYLNDLRAALEEAGVELFSLLVDDGDITNPEHADRDMDWISEWLETAAALGAKCARVIAGKTVDESALERSKTHLCRLADVAEANGVRLMTENWFGVLSKPDRVLTLLDTLEGRVGLCADFGNWKVLSKFDDLAQILPRAESCHAKCSFNATMEPDTEDFLHCLDLSAEADFSGPYTLIYDGPGDDEWAGIKLERQLVLPYVS
ncbi:MAG: sugar phosphate isomerase/epimerase [Anaerolineae bacterium]|nr:sugar phosphate isomerase/epimerase [Anaerolineae bacterium]